MKKPTQKQKIEMYEKFLHKINMCVMCCNDTGVRELVHNADMWSYAFRVGNGGLSERQQQRLITKALWKLCDTPESDKEVEERQRIYTEKKKEREEAAINL